MKESIIEQMDDDSTYNVGQTNHSTLHSLGVVKNTIRLIAYDICSPKRLRHVARTCIDYGVRIEKSVFECDLDDKDFSIFWSRLMNIINPEEDSLIAYKVCRACIKDVQTGGIVERPIVHNAYIF